MSNETQKTEGASSQGPEPTSRLNTESVSQVQQAEVLACDEQLRLDVTAVVPEQNKEVADPDHVQTLRAPLSALAKPVSASEPSASGPLESSAAEDNADATLPLSILTMEDCGLTEVGESGLPERFRVVRELGRGGYGIVVHASDLWLKRDVAIKMLRPELLGNPSLRQRFLLESRAAARLNHPSIVRVLEAGDNKSTAWQISELVCGAPLSAHIRRGAFAERLAARIVRDLADAVSHAHFCGVLHRDIKPDNVLMDRLPGEPLDAAIPRLTDFGLARVIDDDMQMSRSGTLVGTPRYMAPEQLTGHVSEHGAWTDIYALGVILFELVTGQCPFADANSIPQRLASIDVPVKSVRRLHPEVSRDLATICRKCLERKPEHRYETAAAVRDDLQRFLDGRPTLARPLSPFETLWRWARRNTTLASLIGVAIFATGTILGLTLQNNQAFHMQNRRLQDFNDQLMDEQRRVRSLNQSAQELQIKAEAEQTRFQNLAWKSGIRVAYAAWERGNLDEAEETLEKLASSDHRASTLPEWQILRQELRHSFRRLLTIDGPLNEVRIIPNSSLAAVAGSDGNVYVLERNSGTIIRKIETGVPSLHALAVSSDGQLLATGGVTDPASDRSIPLVYNIQTGERIFELPGQLTTIESLEFSGDGNYLAVGPRYQNVKLIEIATGKVVEQSANRRHLWMARSPDGRRIAIHEAPRTIRLIDPGPPFHSHTFEQPEEIFSAIWIPHTNQLVSILETDVGLGFFHVEQSKPLWNFMVVDDAECIHVLEDSSLLIVGHSSGDLATWQIPPEFRIRGEETTSQLTDTAGSELTPSATPLKWEDVKVIEEYGRWHVADSPITSVAASDNWIFATTYGGELLALGNTAGDSNGRSGESRSTPVFHTSVAWSPRGDFIVEGNSEGAVFRTDFLATGPATMSSSESSSIIQPAVETGSLRPELGASSELSRPASGRITGISISPDQKSVAWVRNKNAVFLLQDSEERILWRFPNAEDPEIDAIAFSPDSEQLAWTGSDSLHVADVNSADSQLRSFSLPGRGDCLAWSPNGTEIAVGGAFREIVGVNLSTGEVKSIGRSGTSAAAITYLPSGERLISGHNDGAVRFWNRNDSSLKPLHIHQSSVRSIILSHDSRIGVSVDYEANLALWFVDSGERIGRLNMQTVDRGDRPDFLPQPFLTEDDAQLRLMFFKPAQGLALKKWDLKPLNADEDGLTP
jgi:serine/threonine protein kinase/WD40 repeat protein